jgi:hypothetical protein
MTPRSKSWWVSGTGGEADESAMPKIRIGNCHPESALSSSPRDT